jgi:predicted GIY-YIG superfamily endonuclease
LRENWKKTLKNAMNTAMTVEKDIKMQYKSAWKQEFIFKHDKKWQNIGIIVNVDNDTFHV